MKTYVKRRAKEKGLPFRLNDKRIKELNQLPCSYCGAKHSCTIKTSTTNPFASALGAYSYNGIDRIDSSKGYIEGNVVPCCKTCNTAKMAMPQAEFLAWVERVYNHSIKKETL